MQLKQLVDVKNPRSYMQTIKSFSWTIIYIPVGVRALPIIIDEIITSLLFNFKVSVINLKSTVFFKFLIYNEDILMLSHCLTLA
jgi:hypothetical protein